MAIYFGDGSNTSTGRIVKVSTVSVSGQFLTSSGSFTKHSDLKIDFACSDSNNTVLILATCAADGQSSQAFVSMFVDDVHQLNTEGFGASQASARSLSAFQFKHAPGNTSSHEYALAVRKGSGSGNVEVPPWGTGNQSITAIEVAV
tara:strand:+ start:31 stop:468 length:438 start_codon:yes stop_codon:yes gene_type:complete